MQNTLRFCLPFSLFIFFISRHVLMKWKICAMLAISHPWSHISPRTGFSDMKVISCLNEYVLKDIFIYPSNTIWNVILLPGVDEEIISTSLTPYCCLSIHWRCSVSFSLFFHHYTYWEVKSFIWFGFHGSSGVSIQQETDMSEHHVYVWTERVCVCVCMRVRETDRQRACGDRRRGVSVIKLAHWHFFQSSGERREQV